MKKEDLYSILGVDKQVSTEEIKKAYKDKAKIHHPDKKGDSENFSKLANAYAILKDETKRELYDNTGNTEVDSKEKLINKKAIQYIASTFNAILSNFSDNTKLMTVDIIEEMITTLQKSEMGHRNWVCKQETIRDNLILLDNRIKYRGKGSNILSRVLVEKIEECNRIIYNTEIDIGICGKAIILLRDYTFDTLLTPRTRDRTDAYSLFDV